MNEPNSSDEPTATFLAQYKEAAGEAALVELKARILADKTPEIEAIALHHKLEVVEDSITSYFSADLSPDELECLSLSRQLRNKLFHCDLKAARKKLHELGVPQRCARIKQVRFEGLGVYGMIERILSAAEDAPDSFRYISETSIKDGGVFGWFMELAASGDLVDAAAVFRRAGAILDTLMTKP